MRLFLTSFVFICAISFCNAQMTGITVEVDTAFYGPNTPSPEDTFDPLGTLDGFVTYKVYAEFTNPTDVLSAIYSDVTYLGTIPMAIDAPCGCHNPVDGSSAMDASNSSWFWEGTLMYQYDTYWTIGMDSGDAPGVIPQSILLPPGSEVCSASISDGALFVVDFPINAVAGDDLRILIAQVTTCGDWCIGASFQVFIQGSQAQIQNFQPIEPTCIEFGIEGCVYASACNYDPVASIDDGLCEFDCGCTDSEACNYDDTATYDDGSCMVNDECGECGGDSGCLFCGEGTSWNVDTQTCIVTSPTDTNLDGCTDLNDLMDILAAYGICVEPESAACGYLINHEGYDYSTVQIGGQCWFAENCRYLPSVSPSSEGSPTEPYYYVYGYEGTDVAAAQDTTTYETYGVLYNWPAVMEPGICPSGWHIPSDGEFTELTDFLGGTGVAGGKMKEAGLDHWNSPNTGATNSSGWSGLPGGYRNSGGFISGGNYGDWWSASEYVSYSWARELYYGNDNFLRGYGYRNDGFSARCVRD